MRSGLRRGAAHGRFTAVPRTCALLVHLAVVLRVTRAKPVGRGVRVLSPRSVRLLVFSIAERGERKISGLDRRLICSFSSVQFCFVGFEATSLGVYRFRIVFSS